MDFDEAARAHEAWKAKLLAYFRNPDGSLTHSTVTDDTACDLGKWIYGDARTANANKREYLGLQTAHALFHKAAADVIREANRGEETSEEDLVGPGSAYAIASERVVTCILRPTEGRPGPEVVPHPD